MIALSLRFSTALIESVAARLNSAARIGGPAVQDQMGLVKFVRAGLVDCRARVEISSARSNFRLCSRSCPSGDRRSIVPPVFVMLMIGHPEINCCAILDIFEIKVARLCLPFHCAASATLRQVKKYSFDGQGCPEPG